MTIELTNDTKPLRKAWCFCIALIPVLAVLSLLAVPFCVFAESGAEAGIRRDGVEVSASNLDETIVQARVQLKDNPGVANQLALARLLLRKGLLDEAMQAFDQALTLNARSYEAKTGRGTVLVRKGKLPEAEMVLHEALVQNPDPVSTHYELGVLYQQMGQFEKAAAQFKEGIQKKEQGRR